MPVVKLFVIPCAMALLGGTLLFGLIRSLTLSRRPLQFGQATVVALGTGSASFSLFDGQVIDLTVEPKRLSALQVGDYGRLSYYGDSLLLVSWQRTPHP